MSNKIRIAQEKIKERMKNNINKTNDETVINTSEPSISDINRSIRISRMKTKRINKK